MSLRLLSLLAIAVIHSTDAVVLTCYRDRPTDSLVLGIRNASAVYSVAQVEAASLSPFCLELRGLAPGVDPRSLWSGCFEPGALIRDMPDIPSVAGGPGRALALVVSSQVSGEASTLRVVARLTIEETPIPTEPLRGSGGSIRTDAGR